MDMLPGLWRRAAVAVPVQAPLRETKVQPSGHAAALGASRSQVSDVSVAVPVHVATASAVPVHDGTLVVHGVTVVAVAGGAYS